MTSNRGERPEQIARWRGAEQLASRMEASGFLVPRKYVAWLAAVAGRSEEELREECTRYSTDLVQSPRSWEELQARHPWLFQLRREVALNNARQDELVERLRGWKRAEARPDPFLEKDWRPGAKHVRVVAQRAARREGLRVTRKGYRLDATADFTIEVDLDIGTALSSTIQQISPLTRLLASKTGWSMGLPWREVLLGMDLYNYERDSGGLVWGLQAYLEVAKAFASTLSP